MNLEDEQSAPATDKTSSTESVSPRKPASFFQERAPQVMEVSPELSRRWTRRDLLLFGAGAIAAVAAGGSPLPQTTLKRLGIILKTRTGQKRNGFQIEPCASMMMLQRLYSRNRMAPTYTKTQITLLKNNYNGATPVIFQNGI